MTVFRLFNLPLKYIMVPCKKQQGSVDCGVFAIAYATAITLSASRPDISSIHFDQENLRSHLCKCLEAKNFEAFPIMLGILTHQHNARIS